MIRARDDPKRVKIVQPHGIATRQIAPPGAGFGASRREPILPTAVMHFVLAGIALVHPGASSSKAGRLPGIPLQSLIRHSRTCPLSARRKLVGNSTNAGTPKLLELKEFEFQIGIQVALAHRAPGNRTAESA